LSERWAGDGWWVGPAAYARRMDLGVPELLIVAVVVLLLFGSAKLPEAARSLGKSMRVFKTEMKALRDPQAD